MHATPVFVVQHWALHFKRAESSRMIYFYYLFNILVVGGGGYLIWKQSAVYPLKKYFLPAFLFKITAGILLGVFYQVYFGGGDAQLFQTQSDFVTEYAKVSPASYIRLLLTRKFESETLRTSMIYVWYSNSYFMVMLLSFLNFLTGNNFYLNGLYFSVFSFWGLWQLVQVLVRLYPPVLLPTVIAFLFFPSVVFWSSGIAKEAVYLGSLGWLVAVVLRLAYGLSNRAWLDILFVVVAGYLLWKIKFYFAALVFALLFGYGLVIYLSHRFNNLKKTKTKVLLFCFLALVGALIVANWSEVFKLDYFAAQLIKSNAVLTHRSAGKPFIFFPDLEPTLASFVRHSPAAVFHTFMRPFIWESNSLFYMVAALENIFIMLLLLLTLVELVRSSFTGISLGAVVILIYILILAAIFGLSTPNIGSLNRYRTAILPFLVFLLFCFNVQSKYLKWLKS
ncbi:MAG: hypothetical protein ACO1OF_22085 [Adhaeribacter sp.]